MLLLLLLSLLVLFVTSSAQPCDLSQLIAPPHIEQQQQTGLVRIEGIQLLEERNCTATQVRVNIFSQFQSGVLYLNPEHYSQLATCATTTTTTSSSSVTTSNCHASGSSMAFLAYETDLEVILSDLRFIPFDVHNTEPEFIVIRIDGGNCWDGSTTADGLVPSADSSTTSDKDYYCTRVVIPLPAPGILLESPLFADDHDDGQWYQNALFDSMAVLIFGCLVLCCCVSSHWCKYTQPCSIREYIVEVSEWKGSVTTGLSSNVVLSAEESTSSKNEKSLRSCGSDKSAHGSSVADLTLVQEETIDCIVV